MKRVEHFVRHVGGAGNGKVPVAVGDSHLECPVRFVWVGRTVSPRRAIGKTCVLLLTQGSLAPLRAYAMANGHERAFHHPAGW